MFGSLFPNIEESQIRDDKSMIFSLFMVGHVSLQPPKITQNGPEKMMGLEASDFCFSFFFSLLNFGVRWGG